MCTHMYVLIYIFTAFDEHATYFLHWKHSWNVTPKFLPCIKKYELYDNEWNFTKRGVNAY